MRTSSDLILTTHAGSLPRPADLAELMVQRENGDLSDADAARLPDLVVEAIGDVVARQIDVGLDVVSDGEMGKIGYSTYVKERMTGFDGEAGALALADLQDYPEFTERALAGLVTTTPACTGEVTYTGTSELERDLDALRAAISDVEAVEASDVFVPAASPGVISLFLQNQHYPDQESYLGALADAMRVEYEAIAGAGFLVQIDCPDLAMGRHAQYADLSVAGFRDKVALHVEALNEAVRNIDADQVRLHLCWGNYEGPHHRDVELADIVDLLYRAKPRALVLEACNPRHGHEWRVFEDVPLPDDKILVPGVIDTSSNYIEHPELVAERIARYAGVVGRERVIAGTDCGFSTFASFLPVHPAIGWAKLGSLVEGARLASSRLFAAGAATEPALA
jgi:5-methyltetrahydropteroyltriglutamate--homocysteine methyltransferase